MHVDFLLEAFSGCGGGEAIVWHDRAYSYDWLLNRVREWKHDLATRQLRQGSVVSLEADFSPNSVSLLLALVENACAIAPLTTTVEAKKPELLQVAEVEQRFRIDAEDALRVESTGVQASHEYYSRLRQLGHPGLVLFSSGSTGKPKGVLHDLTPLLAKFKVRRHSLRSVSFLLYDHIGGFNTMMYSLSNGGCLITVRDRSPDSVLEAVAKHRAELLPASPTFLNLILLSEAHKRHDLSSLKTITYGTEPMPESTLRRLCAVFPQVKLQQTYGLSELGILRSKSRSSDSLWVRIGGEGFETRVVDGFLQIKAQSAMLGYLNAPWD